jgi:hypothetical protein
LDIGWDAVKERPTQCPTVVGWEKNEHGKMEPRFVDMSTSMDPTKSATLSLSHTHFSQLDAYLE